MRMGELTNHLVILTCNVKTEMIWRMERRDHPLRLQDYVSAISWWLELSKKEGFKVLIVENSDSIEDIKASLPKKLTELADFHQSELDQESKSRGNSHGEFLMLKDVSSHIQSYKKLEYCWKVTGRLKVLNFSSIAKSTKLESMNLNRFYSPNHLVDTRFFGVSPEVLVEIFDTSVDVGWHDSQSIDELIKFPNRFYTMEHFMSFIALRLEEIGRTVPSLNQAPIFSGFSASTNKRLATRRLILKLKLANRLRKYAIKILVGFTP